MAKIWFGNVSYAQWTPAPATGMSKSLEGYTEEILFDNGGAWVERSNAAHAVYEMDFPVEDSSSAQGIEVYERFASGEFGTEFLRFVDPMRSDENLFSPEWAAPGLAERGHKRVYDVNPTFADTGANSYLKPPRKAVYAVTGASGAVPTGQNSVFTLLIPPTHTLRIGGSGAVTGSGVLRVQPINLNGTLASTVDVTLTADSAAPAFSTSFAGSTYKAVRVYITRTSVAVGTVTLTSLWAQIVPTGATAVIQRHIPGKGHTGLRFRNSAQVERYLMTNRHLVGLSTTLIEVEKWQ